MDNFFYMSLLIYLIQWWIFINYENLFYPKKKNSINLHHLHQWCSLSSSINLNSENFFKKKIQKNTKSPSLKSINSNKSKLSSINLKHLQKSKSPNCQRTPKFRHCMSWSMPHQPNWLQIWVGTKTLKN